MMKQALRTAAALVALSIPAGAADMVDTGYVDPGPVVVQDSFDWTGFYIGVHGGYGGGDFEYPFDFDEVFTGDASINSSGFFAGGQAGFNWQMNNFVFGLETDIAWSDIKGELDFDIDGAPGDLSAGSSVDWFGTTRLRAGVLAAPQLLVYGTGGVAYGDVNHSYDLTSFSPGLEDSTSETQVGWAAGAGFEYMVTQNITLKTEYLYVDLGEQDLIDEGDFSIEADTKFHTIKAGLNFLW